MFSPKFVLLGGTDYLLIDLATALINSGCEVTVVGPLNNRIAKLAGIRLIEVAKYRDDEFAEYLSTHPEIFTQLSGIFIWCGDELMRLVATSDLNDSLKTRILPAGEAAALQILGSKSGQITFFEAAQVPYPASYSLEFGDELPDLTNFKEVMVKGDRHGGGGMVREFAVFGTEQLSAIPQDWYPLILQEKSSGELVSIEACYSNSLLIFWIYSEVNADAYEFGPSISRRFLIPPERDFVSHLTALGEAGKLNGMFNIGMVRDFKSGKHQIFEFDARPNLWHHLYRCFDLDLVAALQGEVDVPLHPRMDEPRYFYEPQRFFNYQLKRRRILNCVRALFGAEIKGFGEPMRNSFYSREALFENWIRTFFFPLDRFRSLGLKISIGLKAAIPARIRQRIDQSPIKRILLGLLTR